jgi:hypothetical protein
MALITFATRTNFVANAVKVQMEAIAAKHARAVCQAAGPQALNLIAAAAPKPKLSRPRSKSLSDPTSYAFDVSRQANGARLNIHIMGDSKFKAKFFSVNYGSSPHPIIGNQWLSFPGTNEFAGLQIAVRSVNHPGTSGVHFYEAALEQVEALIASML